LTGIGIVILIIITLLLFFIRITLINPINDIKSGMTTVAGGSLDYRIKVKNNDEIGELAEGFNSMAEKLKERTLALGKEKAGLEEKVKIRTQELEVFARSLNEKVKQKTKDLNDKIQELERFQKLAVGRESKMIELKKEIERLKDKLEKTEGV
jgi:nitrate/nitrite-specific signal transduction histidine kinase